MDDPQKIWDEYYARIKARRIAEAEMVWELLENADIEPKTEFQIDFSHFGNVRDDVVALARQLSENYEVNVSELRDGYWSARGTSRPYPITLTKEQHVDWVTFMIDVARSYSCVFSVWTIEAPTLNIKVSNENLESEVD